jgi:hypothetical protein
VSARVALVLAALAVATGCTHVPVLPAADIEVRDDRARVPEHRASYERMIFAVCPFVPYYSVSGGAHCTSSFLPAIREGVEGSHIFAAVTACGDDYDARAAAPLIVRVTLTKTTCSRVATTYLLGIFGWILYPIGVPWEYGGSEVTLRVECFDREGRALAGSSGEDDGHGFLWIYEDEERWEYGRVSASVATAVERALDECRERLVKQASR